MPRHVTPLRESGPQALRWHFKKIDRQFRTIKTYSGFHYSARFSGKEFALMMMGQVAKILGIIVTRATKRLRFLQTNYSFPLVIPFLY